MQSQRKLEILPSLWLQKKNKVSFFFSGTEKSNRMKGSLALCIAEEGASKNKIFVLSENVFIEMR